MEAGLKKGGAELDQGAHLGRLQQCGWEVGAVGVEKWVDLEDVGMLQNQFEDQWLDDGGA